MLVKKTTFFIIFLIFSITTIFSQNRPYEGPDDPAADIAAKREGWMSGNRVFLKFNNQVKLADWPGNLDVSQWPNDYSGGQMLNGGVLMIAGKVFLENDSIPVTNIDEINSRSDLKSLYFLEHSIHGGGDDKNPEKTLVWTFHPVFGYFNETSDYPAMSNRPDSWPLLGWPSQGDDTKWSGFWNGRFGKGVFYADLETYIVANDAQDQEYVEEEDSVKYYPRRVYNSNGEIIRDVRIGDKKADVTVQSGRPWGGMGLRIAMRGYQWSNPQARDAIFFEYDISNISDYDLPMLSFGYDVRIGIGEKDANDEYGYYDTELDMAYAWDRDGIGFGGIRTGTFGMAYLESPGVHNDGIDNDEDGLVDEKRDNLAQVMVGPTDGIQDLNKFMEWYGYTEEDLRPHWDADEDQDWMDGFDENNNGQYDLGEDYGHDVGLDGIGPGELNYTGPDEGECNHKPDYLVGVGCEPNFAATDISESDMMGLTTFFMRAIRSGQLEYADDQSFYDIMASDAFIPEFGSVTNLSMIFSSGVFPLKKGRTERISVGMVHSYEELNGLNSSLHTARSLFEKKKMVQFIYEADYRFAQPPRMPTLNAFAGDGKVILTWDDVALHNTREPLLSNVNDFEGYKLYRATDKYFQDAEQLRDMYGEAIGKKPIYQCDLIDNKKGAADFVHINGELYYLGNDTGINNYFVDENVENGRTYYYGLVAYDYGFEGEEVAIMPSENNIVIDIDETENIRFIGKNVQVVVPHQKAASYSDPKIIFEGDEINKSANISLTIADHNSLQPEHTYKIKFNVDTLGHARRNRVFRHPMDVVKVNNGLSVYDVTDGNRLVYEENETTFPLKNIVFDGESRIDNGTKDVTFSHYRNDTPIKTDVFDGIQLELSNLAILGEINEENSDWIVGNTPINITQSKYESLGFPYTYEIVFTDNAQAHTPKVNRESYLFNLETNSGTVVGSSYILTEFLIGQKFSFYVLDKSNEDADGNFNQMEIIVEDVNQNGSVDILEDRFLVGNYHSPGNDYVYWTGTIFGFDFHNLESEEELPNSGDVYRVDFNRPFSDTDSIMFRVELGEEIQKELNDRMNEIKVVPNPYVVTNTMEEAVLNWQRNQRRQLMFTHIPAQCKITIFTVSGVLVDEIMVDNAIANRSNDWDLNSKANGTVHWDLRSNEGLEIAAGYYIYHVESTQTGDVKIGKFAVIK